MSAAPNPHRGEAALPLGDRTLTLRPSFGALCAAEEELGPLFALVERASRGELRLHEMASLFWHCLTERDGCDRETMGEAVLALGLAAAAVPLRALLHQILRGRE
ncbi:gene transfer agent family protein [Novosphingobium fluoreni]|uniref:gene transfer agent family protein n=1 Tax=Novosphingobium fluoreni TaxID=1391222 RepID=UPI0007375FB3|nr:hypothetical protein NS277_06950 [Novosphingobium barchaimii]